ncbi:hypothetical protein ACFYKX_26570 [Cytobacillus sp. FJAT-54145]|uniref:SGNH hydrolase-type esterase domain-containing protein n=1 Tax=Cytobacillus spartinae TaxID=3299023 RepID=A0ABW6KIR5_9BACI
MLTKQGPFTKKVTDLPDTPSPNMTPADIKTHFQTPADELSTTHNKLVDELAGETGASELGAKDIDGTTSNVQALITKNSNGLKGHKEAVVLDHPDGSVTTSKLKDGSVTKEKIKNEEVTNEKLAPLSVTTSKLNSKSVTSEKVGDKQIGREHIKSGAIGINELDQSIYNQPKTEFEVQAKFQAVDAQLAETSQEVKRNFLKPKYIEYFGSFNRFGVGVPSGIAKYTGGKYVLIVSGNAGDSFVTVENGNIADAGASTRWACVIEDNEGLFQPNQVTGTDGVSRVNLLEPLKKTINSKRLGNLHDMALGQHYTEIGYYAFIQHLYFTNPRHTEREQYIAQFKPTDTTGKWVGSGYIGYGHAKGVTVNSYYSKIGSKHLLLNATNNTNYVEWDQLLDGAKGYLESYIGMSTGTLTVEFYKDGVLAEAKVLTSTAERVVFEYENVQNGKLKIKASGTQEVYVGLTTWWKNEKYQNTLIEPNDKVIYIGDSWGTFHNKATTRELERLMIADGGTPSILDFSRGGHTSNYARVWFEEYVIANVPDKVIIEFFTNDFNSINGTVLGQFEAPDGTMQDMNIDNLNVYIENLSYMINKAIEYGIQPIIVMPASTESITQSQSFVDYSVQIHLGLAITNENPSFKSVNADTTSTDLLTQKTASLNPFVIKTKAWNASNREGFVVDNEGGILTNGNIAVFKNAGIKKFSVTHDGGMVGSYVRMGTNGFSLPEPNADNHGKLFISSFYAGQERVYICLNNGDDTYSWKQLSLS